MKTPEQLMGEAVDTVLQGLRTLKLDQVRKQLNDDLKADPVRFAALVAFVIDARKQ